ncbi:MAG: Calx-beta domain-containing protein, partial [SAR324 cluster bacterium]|nr:Calx-beta domain-containing protein [SAR324 cluster bacterium]
MKSLLILFSLFFTLVLSGCKEGTIVYDLEFPRADSDEAQPPPPNVRLSTASSSFAENAGTVLVNATMNKTAESATTVILALSGSATQGLGQDYTIDNTTIVIPAGSFSSSTTLRGLDDSFVDSDETVVLSISSVSGGGRAREDGDQQATVSIIDDDSATVTIADQTTAENSGPSVVTLSVDNAVQGGFSVDVSTSDGSATTADGDYTAVSSQTVSFTGTAGETQTINIPLGSDTKLEADETLTLSLGSVSRSRITITDTATVTVQNDDSAAVTIADVNVAENVAGGTATVTLSLDNAVQGGFRLDVATSNGTATAGSDYTALSGQQVTFAG